MATYTPLQSITLTSAASSITFNNIDQSYTDLVLVANILGYYSVGTYIDASIQVGNGSIDTGNNYSSTMLSGDGSSASSSRTTNDGQAEFWAPALPTDDGTRGTIVIDFCNYSNTTTYKSWLTRFNGKQTANSTNIVGATANVWRTSSFSPINTIKFNNANGTTFYAGSTFSLYGVSPVNAKNAQASGGTNIYYDSSYVYHVFAGTGIFTPARNLTADILVVAGGGGSSNANSAGGGGAGGLVYSASQSLTAGTAYTCTVGAGGVGGIGSSAVAGSQGGNSNVTGGSLSLTAAVGGGYGGGSGGNGGAGGSGGGAGASGGTPSSTSGGLGTSSPILQGYAGGNASVLSGNYPNTSGGGGGGGYTQAGGNTDGQVGKPGYGGAGTSAYSSWGLATGYGQNVSGTYYFAGGGGGGWDYRQGSFASYAVGGNGGGANGVANHIGNNGLSGSGGGGGGSGYDGTTGIYSGGFGGSGVIIVRYAR